MYRPSHIADRLSIPPSNHHPDEFYVVPPLFTDRLDTGDLVEDDSEVYVVVTPRCNMANQPYPKYLTLALCAPMTTEWSELRNSLMAEGEGKKKKGLERLRNLAIQNHATGTHFIPPCGERGPWLVDFKETKSVLSDEMPELIQNRFASIATHFVPNLIQRYAAYLGRIGQPDLNAEFLRAHICK